MAKKLTENADNHQQNDTNNTSTISTYSTVDTTKRESLPPAPTPVPVATTVTAPVANKPVLPKQDIHADSQNDFESRPKAAAAKVAPSVAGETVSRASTDKNDNLSNELKMLQRENDALKIEVANLRVS